MKHKLIILFVLCTFFVISLMTNSMGPIFPALIDSYAIGLTLAGLFPFAFFYRLRRYIDSCGDFGGQVR